MVDSVQDNEFEAAVGAGSVVVDIWATWCGPCKMIAPIVEELAAEHAGSVRFLKADIEANSAAAARYGVRSVPTLLAFKDGTLVGQRAGAANKSELVRWMQSSLA